MWGSYLAEVVDVRHVGQEELAVMLGTSQGSVSRWLTGRKVPTEPARVVRAAQGLGRPVLEAFVAAGMLSAEDAGDGLSAESYALLERVAAREAMRNALSVRDTREDEVG